MHDAKKHAPLLGMHTSAGCTFSGGREPPLPALALTGQHMHAACGKVFLGALREAEVERINARISQAIMETCLAMTIFRCGPTLTQRHARTPACELVTCRPSSHLKIHHILFQEGARAPSILCAACWTAMHGPVHAPCTRTCSALLVALSAPVFRARA